MKRKKRLTAALCLCTAFFIFASAFPAGAVENKKFTADGNNKYSIASPSYTEEYASYLQNGSKDLLVPQIGRAHV